MPFTCMPPPCKLQLFFSKQADSGNISTEKKKSPRSCKQSGINEMNRCTTSQHRKGNKSKAEGKKKKKDNKSKAGGKERKKKKRKRPSHRDIAPLNKKKKAQYIPKKPQTSEANTRIKEKKQTTKKVCMKRDRGRGKIG